MAELRQRRDGLWVKVTDEEHRNAADPHPQYHTDARGDARYAKKADLPVGLISPWAGSGAPTGWLACDGAAVSRTTYAALYAVCGTTYGVGNGSTTFNLPDLRGRTVVSWGAGSFAGARGTKVGAETHQLSVAEMPGHGHDVYWAPGGALIGQEGSGSAYSTWGSHTDFSASLRYARAGDVGGNGAHNNIQPSMVLQYIVKT